MGWDLKVTRTNRRPPDTLEANLVGVGVGCTIVLGKETLLLLASSGKGC